MFRHETQDENKPIGPYDAGASQNSAGVIERRRDIGGGPLLWSPAAESRRSFPELTPAQKCCVILRVQ